MAKISVDNVCLKIGDEEILKNVSLEVNEGEILGIVGRNGSGKTMLMKCICGFITPTSGEIKVSDKIIGKERDFPENTGIIIETPGFIPQYTGLKNLKLLADLKGKVKTPQIIEVLNKVGLDPKLKKSVQKYSLGMRQRLGIAQAVMEDPDVLILDEPFNGLDVDGVSEIRDMLLDFKNQGKTILIASHISEDIHILCDRVVNMKKGVLTEQE